MDTMALAKAPAVSLVAYTERRGDFIFVAVPTEIARYVRTHKCVAYVRCPTCTSVIGEPCKSKHRYLGATHEARRKLFQRTHGTTFLLTPDDVTAEHAEVHQE